MTSIIRPYPRDTILLATLNFRKFLFISIVFKNQLRNKLQINSKWGLLRTFEGDLLSRLVTFSYIENIQQESFRENVMIYWNNIKIAPSFYHDFNSLPANVFSLFPPLKSRLLHVFKCTPEYFIMEANTIYPDQTYCL